MMKFVVLVLITWNSAEGVQSRNLYTYETEQRCLESAFAINRLNQHDLLTAICVGDEK